MENGTDMQIPPEAFEALEAIYKEAGERVAALQAECRQDGDCCRFATSGLRLYVTRLEVAYLLAKEPLPDGERVPGQCPYQKESLCMARSGRPLGCRLYYCDDRLEEAISDLYERFHKALVDLHKRYDIEYEYQEILGHPAMP